MELDDFKDLYNKSAGVTALAREDIGELINRESKGPLAILQKNIRYSLYLYPLSIIIFDGIVISVLGIDELLHNTILWILFSIFFTEFLISVINYFTVNSLQRTDSTLRGSLLARVNLLKLRYRWYLVLNTALFWLMPAFMEIDLHFHLTGEFHGLGKINVFIRIAWYIVVFGGMFMVKKESQRQQYDQYLDKLKSILVQMQ